MNPSTSSGQGSSDLTTFTPATTNPPSIPAPGLNSYVSNLGQDEIVAPGMNFPVPMPSSVSPTSKLPDFPEGHAVDAPMDMNNPGMSRVVDAQKIPSVYQPAKVDLNAGDPALAPGGVFYDPYSLLETGVNNGSGVAQSGSAQPAATVSGSTNPEQNSLQTDPSPASAGNTRDVRSTLDPWASDFKTAPDSNLVKQADQEVAKFDPTPQDNLSLADLYGSSSTNIASPVSVSQVGASGIGGKERISGGAVASEKHPIVEVTHTLDKEREKLAEIEADIGEKTEILQKEHAKLLESVKDDKTGEVLLASSDDAPSIEVPITLNSYHTGAHQDPGHSLRWLYEIIRLFALKGYRIVFKS
jgi:hypothetical protein